MARAAPPPPTVLPARTTDEIAASLVAAVRDRGGRTESFPLPCDPKERRVHPVSAHVVSLSVGLGEAIATIQSDGSTRIQAIVRASGVLSATGPVSRVVYEGAGVGRHVEELLGVLKRVLGER